MKITKEVRFICILLSCVFLLPTTGYCKQKTDYSISAASMVYQRMLDDSLVSTGNNARIKNVIKKAREGKDVTIAYLGGSITEGLGADHKKYSYARSSCSMFSKVYGKQNNVYFVNAGMSGTPSTLGAIRYKRDVLGQTPNGKAPDILFLEFAVNDREECTKGGAYEGLIRRALASGSAVVLIFSVFRDNFNLQDTYIPYGKHYDLPMVSIKNGVSSQFIVNGFSDWYFHDYWHPTNAGHLFMARCIMNLFKKMDQEPKEKDNINSHKLPQAINTSDFDHVKMIQRKNALRLKKKKSAILQYRAGGFKKSDKQTGKYVYNRKKMKFVTNWMHDKKCGKKALSLKVKCQSFFIVYKLSSNKQTGSANVYVDGKKKLTMDGYNQDGWNNARTVVAFHNKRSTKHKIQIRMTKKQRHKRFTVLAFGYQ